MVIENETSEVQLKLLDIESDTPLTCCQTPERIDRIEET